MSGYEISSIKGKARASELGESVEVLYSRAFCRISIVARESDAESSLVLEVITRHDLPLSPSETASRKAMVRRLGRFGFQLVQENGSRVYELTVAPEGIDDVMAGLVDGWSRHADR
jgi:hypothetical protein